ncbi:MAG: hypothetical protein JXA51_00530 [Dehalococcoidales bacterium]|nr:hypothetical protein [Dehalococcoidales bacterium]
MKGYRIFIYVAAFFLAASALFYGIHYLIFQDPHHIFIYMLGDFAFLPLEVFIVVIVIERILTRREKQAMLYKLNMVIGAFFSEVGNHLLSDLLEYFKNREEIACHLNVTKDWTDKDFRQASAYAYNLKANVDIDRIDLEELKAYLSAKRLYLLTLLENPNLLEHDRFTDLLWATTHLDEELEARPSLKDLPREDLEHLSVDIERMYDHLTSEWLDYVQHLKATYPFLYSLVLRTHPYQEKPSAVFS